MTVEQRVKLLMIIIMASHKKQIFVTILAIILLIGLRLFDVNPWLEIVSMVAMLIIWVYLYKQNKNHSLGTYDKVSLAIVLPILFILIALVMIVLVSISLLQVNT